MAKTKFVLNDQASGYPTRTVATTASRLELDRFLGDGFLVQRGCWVLIWPPRWRGPC
jgi:hypothetical protein